MNERGIELLAMVHCGLTQMQLNDSDGSVQQERYHEYILRKLRELKENGKS